MGLFLYRKEVKKLYSAALIFVLSFYACFSQQDPITSNYMFNTLSYNPGIAGTSGMICATAINRQQWIGFKGAPSTTIFNITLYPEWVIPSGDAFTPPAGDPLIPESKESSIAFDAGLGVYYRTDKYYAGISVTHIT